MPKLKSSISVNVPPKQVNLLGKTSGSVMGFAKALSLDQNELGSISEVKRSSSFKLQTPTVNSEATQRYSDKGLGLEEATYTTNKIFKGKKFVAIKKQATLPSSCKSSLLNAYATNPVTSHNSNSRSTAKPFRKKP